MKRVLMGLGVLAVVACAKAAEPPVVTIQSPEQGWMGAVPLKLTFGVTGATIAAVAEQRAGGAHLHLFVDVDLSPEGAPIPAGEANVIHLGGGQTEYTFDSMAVGTHRIIAVLGDNNHVRLPGQRTDTVEVMIH